MDKQVENIIKNWQKRNIEGFYAQSKEEAIVKVLGMISLDQSIGFSGSETLAELGLIELLEKRGNRVFNPYKTGISREESLNFRKQAAEADYYLASPNAISKRGELVFFSAYGNRTAGVAYAKNVLVVSGQNKVVANIDQAVKRSREYATPLNCKRLNWNTPCFKDGICHEETCIFPEYKRMCCQILIIEAEAIANRLKVLLVGEDLGF